ncbi:MAG: hypothetical protein QOH86_1998 [Sphingomonadales bacterium]|jgi:hypothetical protein|nr:hypothetical protein [Sphingomonadales bacterium]
MARYRHALGEFIHDFAWLEVCLVHVLCAVAGIKDEIGPVLFSGTRANDLISFIRKCYIAQEREIEIYLDRALTQVSLLNSARNEVVHFTTFGIEDSEDAVLATNQFRLMPGNVKNRLLTPEVLLAMSKDARVISGMLAIAEAEGKDPGSTGDQIVSEMNGKQPPWHYRPVSLPDRRQPGSGTPAQSRRARRGRPPPSEE